jgi:hypothetical protein
MPYKKRVKKSQKSHELQNNALERDFWWFAINICLGDEFSEFLCYKLVSIQFNLIQFNSIQFRDVLKTRDPVDIPCTRIKRKMESPAVSYGRLWIYDIIIKKKWKKKPNNKLTSSFNRSETRSTPRTPQSVQQKIDFFLDIWPPQG